MTQATDNGDPRRRVWDRTTDRLYADAQQQYDKIRNNAMLNDDVRLAFIAETYLAYRDNVQALEGADALNTTDRRERLERTAFGIDDMTSGTSAAERASISLAFRDAQERAAQLPDDNSALASIRRAASTGDELLVRAIGYAACSTEFAGIPHFPETAAYYLATHPRAADAVNQLAAINRPSDIATMWQFITPKPSELATYNDNQIQVLANRAKEFRTA